jgi:hypothetical protein
MHRTLTEDNRALTKAQLLEEMKPLPKGLAGRLRAGKLEAEVHGNVTVTTYIAEEWLSYYGQVIENEFRMTDTWLKTDAGWRLIASQVLAVLEDPPAIALPRETLCGYNGVYRLTVRSEETAFSVTAFVDRREGLDIRWVRVP